ncbi:MAG: VOC family protein [Verrucomicrobia bacterium]|nr:VOC family protein [Verrucomicrobiota bacterium]
MSELEFALEHLGLPAQHPAALKEWYVATLGARVVFENPPAYFVALPGGVMLEIYSATARRAETADNGLGGFRHLALRVDSIAATRVELERRGVKFTEPVKPAGGGGSVLFFSDAEGNLLHLVERPDDSVFNAKTQRR